MRYTSTLCLLTIFASEWTVGVHAWGGKDKVKLTDIDTLTLYYGRKTTGRRTQPVSQLQCVGGSAGCGAVVPQVIQCYNRGTDGSDVQWECKTDMDNAYRFGKVTVTCEGYDYPDDHYVLKGSCGLEYTLDFTKDGYQKRQSGQHNYYEQSHHKEKYYQDSANYSKKGSGFGDLIIIAIVGIIIYAIYRSCMVNQYADDSGTGDGGLGPDTHRPSWFRSFFGGGGNGWGRGTPPPAYGFRQDYMPNEGCSGTSGRSSGTGSFWTGAATGGILGYMLGNRGSRSSQPYSTGYDSWGGTRHNSSFSSESSSSNATRTASGFGGTRRR